MTITTAALRILTAAQSGVLENTDQPLRELNALLTAEIPASDMPAALRLLEEARIAAYSHRFQIVRSLKQLEQSALYSDPHTGSSASWEMSG